MIKNKSTKNKLIDSFLSMLICLAMLIDSTFAWFTDSVVSGNNKIVAGNLDVELYHSNEYVPDGENGDANGISIHVKNDTVKQRVKTAQGSAYGYDFGPE